MRTNKKKARTLLTVAALGFSLAFLLYLLSRYEAQSRPKTNLLADSKEVVAMGRKLYRERCSGCHGANLEGEENWRQRVPLGRNRASPLNGTGWSWEHDDATLFAITKFGVRAMSGKGTLNSNMPAYEDLLSDNEIIAVLSYIKSMWPAEVRAKHEALNQQQEN